MLMRRHGGKESRELLLVARGSQLMSPTRGKKTFVVFVYCLVERDVRRTGQAFQVQASHAT